MITAPPGTTEAPADRLTPEEQCAAFGERLCKLRSRPDRRMSQAKLAEAMTAAGVDTKAATVARIESGAQQARLAEVFAAATALQTPVAALLGLEPAFSSEEAATRACAEARASELERIREGFAEWVDGRLVAIRREAGQPASRPITS